MDNRPIGVMDSGAGGLTVVRALKSQFPNETVIYFGDSARNPYGERPRGEIFALATEGKRFLLSQNVKAVIVACNTITFNVPRSFYEEEVPVVGMSLDFSALPPVSTVAVFATPASISTHRHREGVLRSLPFARVAEVPCAGLAGAIEKGAPKGKIESLVRDFSERYGAATAGAVIFGCTHYPLVEDVFSKVFPGAFLLDPAARTVNRAMKVLAEKDALSQKPGEDVYYFTGEGAAAKRLLSALGLSGDLRK